jgi:hypothetical protein
MASRLERVRYGAFAASAMLLGASGCAFPHGATGGDPLLGSFSRPIVPTPPPERGGLGPDSPAYDAGARIGVAPPEVPAAVENSTGFMTLPTRTTPSLFSAVKRHGDVRPVRHEVLRDPSLVRTMEEGHALLHTLGATGQRTEQHADGLWVWSCMVGQKACEGRGADLMDALRELLEQVEQR